MKLAGRKMHLSSYLLVIIFITVLAATTVTQFVYFENDRIYVYMVLAFDLSVTFVALILAYPKFFFWTIGVVLGFVLVSLVVIGSLMTARLADMLYGGLVTGSFFALLGFVVGLLAQSIDSLHQLIHEAAKEETRAGE